MKRSGEGVQGEGESLSYGVVIEPQIVMLSVPTTYY